MRGKPARTVGELQAFDDVVEYILTSKAGYTRADLYGDERSGYHVERRTDLSSNVRRVCAAWGRRRVAATCGAPFAFGGVTAATAGLESTAVFFVVTAAVVAYVADRYLPDVVFDAPDPKATVTQSSTPGMTEREVYRRLAIHGEREELKEERVEKQRKRRERKAKAKGNGRF